MIRKGRKIFLHGNCSCLTIIDSGDHRSLDVKLTLTEKHENKSIECRFFGVAGLEIGDINHYRTMSLEIKDISHENLSGFQYHVAEVVNEVLIFRCGSLEIIEE